MKVIEHACSKEMLNKDGTMPAKMWTHPHTHTLDKNWIIIVIRWELNPMTCNWTRINEKFRLGFSAYPLAIAVENR